MSKKTVIIDFDSTFVKLESLDELAKLVLEDADNRESVVAEITEITNQGMNGQISFSMSLQKRLQLFSPTRKHIDMLVAVLQENITPSFVAHQDFIKDNARDIYIISGGFKEYITPIVKDFGISEDHVLANSFLFDNEKFMGIDTKNYMAGDSGKVKVVRHLGLSGDIAVIGDGMTDYQIREQGLANRFIAFGENVTRDVVFQKADFVAKSFNDVRKFLES